MFTDSRYYGMNGYTDADFLTEYPYVPSMGMNAEFNGKLSGITERHVPLEIN
jgi:hypothetical protein